MMTEQTRSIRNSFDRFEATVGEVEMSEDSKRSRRRRERHAHWDHGGSARNRGEDDAAADRAESLSESENDTLERMDESLLTDDQRAYRAARRLADQKVALSRELFRAGIITIPLLFFIFPVGMISLIYFGVKLGRHAFRVFYEPKLRERFMQEEVQRRVRTHVSSERRHLEGEHHRTLEQLAASIAHEIRNPITAAKSLVQQMGEDAGGADQEEYARVAVAELERVERSISHLLRFGREEEARIASVAMEDVLESAIETFRDRASRAGVEIAREYDGRGELDGDPEQLRRVAINLISNAIDALEGSGVEGPEIRVSMGENLAGNEIWVRIVDNGRGIDADARDRIFDPFFTSRENGTGLGLALCRKIVDQHQGTIDVESTLGEGTEFVLTFPRTRPVASDSDAGRLS